MPINEYMETWYEYNTLMKQVCDMRDDTLVEELMHCNFYETPDIDDIYAKFMKEGELTEAERTKLLGLYVLIHCEEEFCLK